MEAPAPPPVSLQSSQRGLDVAKRALRLPKLGAAQVASGPSPCRRTHARVRHQNDPFRTSHASRGPPTGGTTNPGTTTNAGSDEFRGDLRLAVQRQRLQRSSRPASESCGGVASGAITALAAAQSSSFKRFGISLGSCPIKSSILPPPHWALHPTGVRQLLCGTAAIVSRQTL